MKEYCHYCCFTLEEIKAQSGWLHALFEVLQLAREKLFLSEKGEVLFTLPKKDEKKQKNDESSN